MIELRGASPYTEPILGIPPRRYGKQFAVTGKIHLATRARRLKELEKENARLKKLVADLSLDKAFMQATTGGSCVQIIVPFSFPESGI